MNKKLILIAFLPIALVLVGFFWLRSKKVEEPKIYDTFLFYNELDLLTLRLEEHYDHVDYFVLLEATETFTGKPKELFFQNNKDKFEKYADKIIHIITDKHIDTDDAWVRERYQRDYILKGLENCHQHDIILLSDVDEIINVHKMDEIINNIKSKPHAVFSLDQKLYTIRLNRYKNIPYVGTTVATYRNMKKMTPEEIRRGRTKCPTIKNAGWHFSSIGGFKNYVNKIESFSHTECNKPENKTLNAYESAISNLILVPIDDTFPKYIQKHVDELRKIGLIE